MVAFASRSPKQTRELLARLAILYRVQRTGEVLTVLPEGDDQFVGDLINRMNGESLLVPAGDGITLRVSENGRKVLGQMVAIFDRTVQLNIFARVYVTRDLEPGQTDEAGNLFGDMFDPRFGMPDEPTNEECMDMRLSMLAFLAETHPSGRQQEFDPYVVVFLQKLMDGELESERFWQNLRVGSVFSELRDIIDTAKTWRSMHPDEETARKMMGGLYAAGMAELRKRRGDVCAECEAPLGLFEAEAKAAGLTLESCPRCRRPFGPPPDDNVVGGCPRCGGNILRDDTECRGCGAAINYALPPGTVETTTEIVTEVVEESQSVYAWTGGYRSYGYVPVAYYEPWAYPADLFLTALVIDALWN